MSHVQKDNKAHGSHGNNRTSTKDHIRAVKARAPFGENNGTVQHRTDNPLSNSSEKVHKKRELKEKINLSNIHHKHLVKKDMTLQDILSKTDVRIKEKSKNLKK